MYVKYLTFLSILSKSLKYTTSMYIKSQKKHQLVSGLTKVIQLYANYGFVVNFINNDNKFETLRDNFPREEFNIKVSDEHIPEYKRNIRVVKERTWAVCHTLPFRKILEKIIIRMVNFSVF